ncbi:MAG: ankyrin repeat domain-containing protein [Verrucomicrobiota bacterium]
MKTNLLISGILLGAVTFISAATNDLTSAIQRGLFEEEANQNLGAAIQAYQAVASQFDKDRKLAATAIFRLGECYRKQGNTNDAATQYQRILRDFSDQPTLVTLSRQNLAVLGNAPAATAAPVMSDAARQEQKRLLEEEIKLVQKQLDEQKQRVQNGTIAPGDLLPTEREILKLKRQVAALDAGLPVSFAATEATAPAVSSEAEEVRRIQALIKDSPDLINAPVENGLTLLKSAAKSGKLTVVKALLENGAAVDGLQQPGLTALHYAAANGHKAVIDLLLSKGAKAGAESESGVTPLHLASGKGYVEVAKALLAAGAPVNARGTKAPIIPNLFDLVVSPGKTPLHLAANAGYSGMVELLLTKGADVNAEDGEGRTPLSYAIEKHYQPVAQRLLAAHANPNAGRINLPLAVAANSGDIAALKLLLVNGADPNTNAMVNWAFSTKDSNHLQDGKCTPLFLAVNQRHADAARELVRCKADPNGPDPNQRSLLYEALPDASTLGVLLDAGADPNQSVGGVPLLVRAVWDKNQPAVELLLAHHAEVNCTNSFGRTDAIGNGQTPLHAAAALGSKAIAELLLKAGAAVNAKDQSGETPLYVAISQHQPEVAALLLANKADPNAKKANPNAKISNGWTPLHAAASDGQRELVELLLANKADPNERSNDGKTPLDLAKSQAQSAPGLPSGASRSFQERLQAIQASTGAPAAAPRPESKPDPMVDLLRRHGAVDDLPQFDRIQVRRTSTGQSSTSLTKGTHDWGQFTLLDLIGVQYQFLGYSPEQEGDNNSTEAVVFAHESRYWSFPDLAHLRIRRPTSDPTKWQERDVDLRPLLESGDCSKDVLLEWGDVVEIPEANHPLNQMWSGFSKTELANLKKCLTRQVQIVINGQTTNITLAPQISNVGEEKEAAFADAAASYQARLRAAQGPHIIAHTPFWLKPVLLQSKLVLTSSDLSRVKVTRPLSPAGRAREWIVDCSQANLSPDFWLRDGDKIEVPEKTDAPPTAAPGPQSAPPK